ncbi:pyridoxal phosphate-dependent decarboxylase family protein [Wenzhouxiangella sp. EGI_FJ10305]|uniref:pyridoxal phosphate-dependent decarboxylase family protein n=1 Tax=Wenzhouxiangella sp. EGI_FJ10305 TaxID=3243768 RepID=UPI0035D6F34E
MGRSRDDLIETLYRLKENDVPWAQGRVFAYVYDPGPSAQEIVHDAFDLFLTENGLDPTAFPSALQLEREIIGMAVDLVNGPDGTVGNFTSGGTESIMLSVKTARDRARERQPRIRRPQLVLPETAHAAFFKACRYFDIEPVVVPVDPQTFQADVVAMARAVTDNTILLVASAPSYAHGVIDPIASIGCIALKHDLLFHVDACMGGMYLPFAGDDIPPFDFRVPGVSQLSMDFHKWGYAAKGASAILYRSADVRRFQIFAWSGWTGYSVVNPTMLSTRGAGPLAACWAVLNFLGREGYTAMVADCQGASQRLQTAINDMPDLYCLGQSDCNLFSFASDAINVFTLAQTMRERGWYIQPQFGFGPSPANVHISLGQGNLPHVDAFIEDLGTAVAEAERLGPVPPAGSADPQLAALPAEALFEHLGATANTDGTTLPERMDEINNLLNGLPHATRDHLLAEFINRLYTPDR